MSTPSTITPKLIESICEHIRSGNYAQIAVRACGVNMQTWGVWQKAAKDAREQGIDTPETKLMEAIAEAEADGEIALVHQIKQAAHDDPKNAQWLLSRRHSERWAQQSRQVVSGPDGGAVHLDVELTWGDDDNGSTAEDDPAT